MDPGCCACSAGGCVSLSEVALLKLECSSCLSLACMVTILSDTVSITVSSHLSCRSKSHSIQVSIVDTLYHIKFLKKFKKADNENIHM